MPFLLIFITGALIVMALFAISNVLIFPRLRQNATLHETPFVSILIPARNEAAIIGQTVRALLAQSHPRFELLILDDHSTDGTAEIVHQAAAGDPRVRVLTGEPLPSGWAGKNWACQQLGAAAAGEVLVFTDADVQWQPEGLAAVLAQMQQHNADLATVWPTQTTITPAERLVVPLMAFAILAYLPVIGTHYTPWAMFAAANGQCMAWRSAAYRRVGGHQRVADNVLEDVTLARAAKAAGLRLRMIDGAGLIGCRMYTHWPQVRDGFAKNILAGYGNSVPVLLLATVFHWIIFLLPWALLLVPAYATWAAALIIMGWLLRALTAAASRQRWLDALAMPMSVLLMTRIALRSIAWHYSGGPRWKGRVITRQPATEATTTAITEGQAAWQTTPSSSSARALGD